MIYTTSIQLGFNYRILGIVCGCIPIINIYMLIKIIKTTTAEYKFEKEKIKINLITR